MKNFWINKKYPYIIRILYNLALNRRLIRKQLVEDVGLNPKERWVVLPLKNEGLLKILELGEADESFIIY